MTSLAAAQATPPAPLDVLKGRPDKPAAATGKSRGAATAGAALELGPAFESEGAGIAFRPMADAREIRRGGVPDEIVQFLLPERQWVLKVSRFALQKPVPLVAPAPGGVGLLDNTLETLKRARPNAEVLRQDVVNIGDADVGMLAMRYTTGTEHRLAQQAIVGANDLLYYVLELTTPGAKPHAGADQNDPEEHAAVATFGAILDTVRLLDRGKLRDDQVQRLFRTRALLVNTTEAKIRSTLVDEQWLRLIKGGKDIGYTYIVEEVDEAGTMPIVKVGVRSRTMPDEGARVDSASWMHTSMDRRHEEWSSVAVMQDAAGNKDSLREVGSSDREIARVLDPRLGIGEGDDEKQPPVRQTERYMLNVRYFTRSGSAEPVKRDLPPYYLPQALGHLLPRLVPVNENKSYLFASYITDSRELMHRYVDVGKEMEVTLAGKKVWAIPVSDRVGVEGSVTTHYMTSAGQYLGSVNKDSKIAVLPTDKETLLKLWQDADLTRPQGPEAQDGQTEQETNSAPKPANPAARRAAPQSSRQR